MPDGALMVQTERHSGVGATERGVSVRALSAIAYAGMAVFGIVLLLMGSLLPSMPVSYAQAGTLGSLPLIGILIATIFVGPFLDTLGTQYILALSIVLIAAPLAIIPSLQRFAPLAAAALVYGFGGGLLNTAVNAFVSDLHATRRGAALNLLGAFFSLGAIAAPLLLSASAGRLSSGAVVRVLAVAILLLLIPVVALRFPPPAHAGSSTWQMLGVLSQPLVWFFGALLFFESGQENCMFVWGGKIVADVLSIPGHRADRALVGLTVAIGVGRLIAVGWLRWIGSRATLVCSAAAIIVGALITHSGASFAVMFTGLCAVGLGMSAIYPTALSLAGDRFPRETGTVFGAIMAVALVGGVLAPRSAAWVTSGGAHPLSVLWVPVIASAAIAALTLVMPRQRA